MFTNCNDLVSAPDLSEILQKSRSITQRHCKWNRQTAFLILWEISQIFYISYNWFDRSGRDWGLESFRLRLSREWWMDNTASLFALNVGFVRPRPSLEFFVIQRWEHALPCARTKFQFSLSFEIHRWIEFNALQNELLPCDCQVILVLDWSSIYLLQYEAALFYTSVSTLSLWPWSRF